MLLSYFAFRPSERFLYEYDFTVGWQIEVRVVLGASRRTLVEIVSILCS